MQSPSAIHSSVRFHLNRGMLYECWLIYSEICGARVFVRVYPRMTQADTLTLLMDVDFCHRRDGSEMAEDVYWKFNACFSHLYTIDFCPFRIFLCLSFMFVRTLVGEFTLVEVTRNRIKNVRGQARDGFDTKHTVYELLFTNFTFSVSKK